MNIVVQIYMIVCMVLLAFDIVFLIVKNARNQRFYPRMPKFEKRVWKEIQKKTNTGEFSPGFMQYVGGKIRKTKYLLALQGILEENPFAGEWFKEMLYSVLPVYKKKSDYEQAYYAYVISTLDYERERVPAYFTGEFLTLLRSKSLYTFCNTMACVYAFGDIEVLLTAMDVVDERAGFYHKKLLVDGLLSARADKEKLSSALMERYEKYSDFTKECLLDYFRYAGVDAAEFCRKVIRLEPADSEVRYTAMRYFIKYPDEKSRKMFERILQSGEEKNWIEEMLSIQGLGQCKDEKVRKLIKDRVTGRNWYVRINALAYLKNNGMDQKEIEEIIGLGDPYTNEALLYQYREDPEMSDYIRNLFKEEDEK